MRRFVLAILALAVVATAVPSQAVTGHNVLMSNFRFCNERPFPCDPADVGYVGNPAAGNAPAAPVYSPITTTNVKPGEWITWIYDEPLCATGLFCPPHNVTFTDGSFISRDVAVSRTTASYLVPEDAKAGTITYFCKYHAGAGMNGVIVVGAA